MVVGLCCLRTQQICIMEEVVELDVDRCKGQASKVRVAWILIVVEVKESNQRSSNSCSCSSCSSKWSSSNNKSCSSSNFYQNLSYFRIVYKLIICNNLQHHHLYKHQLIYLWKKISSIHHLFNCLIIVIILASSRHFLLMQRGVVTLEWAIRLARTLLGFLSTRLIVRVMITSLPLKIIAFMVSFDCLHLQ